MDKKQWAMLEQKKNLLLSFFPDLPKTSGIYIWTRLDEKTGIDCVYIGKAKNVLERSAQHLLGNESHLDKSIKKHGLYAKENPSGWYIYVEQLADEPDLDRLEQWYIANYKKNPNVKLYNIESGGTKGKTIIGERKQRRDVSWRQNARARAFADLRKWFDLSPLDGTIKDNGCFRADAQRLYDEFYEHYGRK